MDAGLVNVIVQGAVSLSSAFIGFGAQVYAIDHTHAPSPDINNYTITLPSDNQQSSFSAESIMLVVVLVIVLVVVGVIMYKYV